MNTQQLTLAAYEQIKPEMGRLQNLVYAVIAAYGPLTDVEIEEKTGLKGSTSRPRRVELTKSQWIKLAGYKIQDNGRKATLWKVT